MDRDRTLPAWPDLLQLLLEYFLDMSLHSGRGEGEVLFLFIFFLGFERVNVDLVNTAWRPYRAIGPTGGPRKAAWQPRSGAAGQPRPIKGPFCIFFLFHHFPPTPHSLQKFLEFLELSESFLLVLVR